MSAALKLLCVLFLATFAFLSTGAAQGDFFDQELADSAVRYEEGLADFADPGVLPAAHWRTVGEQARARDDTRAAAVAYAAGARAAPQDATLWVLLGEALAAIRSDDYSERYELLEQASAAAYLGYLRAKDAALKARALARLGATLAERHLHRSALEAYQASLALDEDAMVRAQYATLREAHGFRILDYSVDSDIASPRMCVQFSEPLARGRVDFAQYVRVDGADPAAVNAEETQLCIEGFRHGTRYQVHLRAGLPSAVGESLPRPADYTVYVRDRTPAVRFTGRGYVLPRTGQQGLPLVSVNTDAVEIEIYRIGDRGLGGAVAGEELHRQLYGYDLENLAETKGSRVWQGRMPVERRLNEDVTTAFPVDEALPELAPGVYVLVAAPAGQEAQYWEARATQWFIVSDLGLAAISGDGGIHGFVRSLASAQPLADVELRLIARNNEVLGTARSDSDGAVRFDPGLARGTGGAAPAVLIAGAGDGDYAFLDLTAPGFDLSDRGVMGRAAPGPLDAYVFAERGVYRPGAPVHVTALLRDREAKAVADVPLTLVFMRPDGVEHARVVTPDQALGGRSHALQLLDSAMTGTWRVAAYADPEANPVGETTFLVEDFVPDRMALELTPESDHVAAGGTARIQVEGRYLYGAPAADLALEGDVVLRPRREGLEGFAGYVFGLEDEQTTPLRRALHDLPRTGADGTVLVAADLPPLPQSTHGFIMEIALRLREPGGRAVEKAVALPVRPAGPMIGIRPLFADGHVGQGTTAGFDVVAVSPDGARTSLEDLRWQLHQIDQRFQWYREHGRWRFEPITYQRRVAEGRLDARAEETARLEMPVQFGRYRLEVTTHAAGADAPATSVAFTAGWYAAEAAEAPDFLEIALDKSRYRPGETARVHLIPRAPGKALVAVVKEGIVASRAVDLPAEGARVDFEVGDDWFPGAYVTAMAYRPMDEGARRMPGRSVGVAWLGLDLETRELRLELDLPERAPPRSTLDVPIEISGLSPGAPAHVVVSAVDVGILNLTGHEPPAPEDWYYAQRRLAPEFRDLYGRLIDGMRAERGAARSGGDAGGPTMRGSPPTQIPLSLYSGIVDADSGGKARVAFDLPNFNGTVKVMAVAWSGDKLGHAARDVIVRDPVLLTATLPRFLGIGDTAQAHVKIDNFDGPAGEYRLALRADGPVVLSAPERAFTLAPGDAAAFDVPLAANGAGQATVTATLFSPDGGSLEQAFALPAKPASPAITRRSVQTLAAGGGTMRISSVILADFVPESARMTVSVSPGAALDVPGLLLALDRYPFGCAEQITSRALPLLYVGDVAARAGLAAAAEAPERIDKAIGSLLAMQSSSGAFGLWGPSGYDIWLTAYVSDFLARARERGHAVPQAAFDNALDRLANHVANTHRIEDGGALAYALYVLARAGRANVGDLRYFADTALDDFDTALAKAQLAAALAMHGDSERAARVFEAAVAAPGPASDTLRADYGSALRDRAGLLTLAAETGLARSAIPAIARQIEQARATPALGSTQENAWLLLAAHALQQQAQALALTVDGAPHDGALLRAYGAEDLARAPVTVANRGAATATVTVTVTGAPVVPEPAATRGFTIERELYTLDGAPRPPGPVAQNQRLVVVLRAVEIAPMRTQLVLADYLPAGFEIENPRLGSGGGAPDLPWFARQGTPEYTEYRDDRFVAAYQLDGQRPATVRVAYVVRAVTPGSFAHPPAVAEDMYRPDRFARTASGTLDIAPAR